MNTDGVKNVLKALFNQMPAVRALRGEDESDWSENGLMRALKGMPVFDSNPQSAYDAAMQIGPMGLGKIVYHGSPHKFDKFDASKIGTGEGAQAYGHGVYLADSEGVAGQYKNLAPREFLDGPINWDNPIHVGIRSADLGGSVDGGIARLMRTVQARTSKPENIRIAREAIEFLRSGESFDKYAKQGGALYKADLPDEWIPKMLDWDKPLKEQSAEVQSAIAGLTKHDKVWARNLANNPNMKGEELYKALSNVEAGGAGQWNMPGNSAGATNTLNSLGIPGIRYLDGGSRGAGQGSYNYVVFPGLEDQVKILERNGQPVNMIADALMRSRR